MTIASSDILEDVEIMIKSAKEQSRMANYYFAKGQIEKSMEYLQDAMAKLEYEICCKEDVERMRR